MSNTDSLSSISIAGIILAISALVGVGITGLTFGHAEPYIKENQKQVLLRNLSNVLSGVEYNNELTEDKISVTDVELLGSKRPVDIYRARNKQQAIAAVITSSAPNGYNGEIKLVIGIKRNGELSGVRVVSHKETPGLGDGIELPKSNWILSFNNKSLTNTTHAQWNVKKDGGEFDQLTGATITPRAIISAVENTLVYFQQSRNQIFSEIPDSLKTEIDKVQ